MFLRLAQFISLIAFCFAIGSCASSRMTVITKPSGADIKIYNHKTHDFVKVAASPSKLNLNSSKIKKLGKPLVFSIEKAGYEKEKLIIDRDTSRKTTLKINLERKRQNQNAFLRRPQPRPIQPALQKLRDETKNADPNELTKSLLVINRFVNSNQYNSALTSIDRLIRKHPKASVFWDMKGSVHLLQGKKQLAIAAYQRALALDPTNYETKAALNNLLGGRK